ncbi:MAG: selenide, water dikinase SelD [Anaerolineales bacterium]|nr:selenide, water dikinase SelD [Anaerolineales bacterium]
MGPEALTQVLRPLAEAFPPQAYPQLLVGLGAPDDAAVYQLNSEQAIIATADFFPPVVDDAYDFGAIAAANALSDVYAMGGEPLFALNLAALPEDFPPEVAAEIFRGGAEKVREAGAVIAGGHTVTDKEPKYGLSVTGVVHPQKLKTKGGARPGDVLILTKPLGLGVITTANKRGQAQPEHVQAATEVMKRLNRAASRAAQAAHALTDITGYSLLGHAHEMAHLSNAQFEIEYAALPWLPGAQTYAQAWAFPGGAGRNAEFYGRWVRWERALTDWEQQLLFDPQTSGGLLMAVAPEHVEAALAELSAAGELGWVIGAVSAGGGQLLIR